MKNKYEFMLDNLNARLQMIADKQIEELKKALDIPVEWWYNTSIKKKVSNHFYTSSFSIESWLPK